MRISTVDRYDATISDLQKRQVELSRVQLQMTSGKRIAVPSDDPTGVARAERAYIAQQRINSDQRSLAASRSSMTLAESALGQGVDVLQSARETMVNAGNGSMGHLTAERIEPGQRASGNRRDLDFRRGRLVIGVDHAGRDEVAGPVRQPTDPPAVATAPAGRVHSGWRDYLGSRPVAGA